MDPANHESLDRKVAQTFSPIDFDVFLPWVCNQLSIEVSIVIHRTYLGEYVSVTKTDKKSRAKAARSRPPSAESQNSSTEVASSYTAFGAMCEPYVTVETVYESNLKLVAIKFLKNKKIPPQVFKMLGLMIPYHPTLRTIVINSGLQMAALYEISKFLIYSNITEICLDNTYLAEANYHVLLGENDLKVFSLSKCGINDSVIETIAAKLLPPCRAASTLSVLNLATNRITDVGARYLANALRTNRQLAYLNISDNLLTDKGAGDIFDALKKFPLTAAELKQRNLRYMKYLKKKQSMIMKTIKELRSNELAQRASKRKSIKPVTLSKKNKIDSKISPLTSSACNLQEHLNTLENTLFQRAEVIVNNTLGSFRDPFSRTNTVFCNDLIYCYGNNSLCYLNIAYNNLTYFSVEKLYNVLLEQKQNNRKPSGLINVRIDGNFMPKDCFELQKIDQTLEAGLSHLKRYSIFQRKSPTSK